MTPDQFEQFLATLESIAASLQIIREAVEQVAQQLPNEEEM